MVVLQVEFRVPGEKVADFIDVYDRVYAPALSRQVGYVGSRLLQIFDDTQAAAIGAEQRAFNIQLELAFETEEQRKAWAASTDHVEPWEQANALAEEVRYVAYDIRSESTA